MATEVKLPDLGDGVDSGDVLEVLVSEGDVIAKDQGVIELETDKASVEIPSTVAGKVVKVHVKNGQSISPGDVMITVEAESGAESKSAPAEKPPAKEEEPAEKEEPKAAKQAEAEEEEAPVEKTPAKKPAAKEGQREEKEAPITAKAQAAARPAARETSVAAAENGNGSGIAAGPAIRRFAREVGVDLARVHGTGPGGRITREDVLEVVRHANKAAQGGTKTKKPSKSAIATVTPPGEEGSDHWGPVRIERMSKIRRTIAAKMHESWTTVSRVTNFDDADVTELEKIRQSSKDDYAAAGIKLTAMPFVIKAVALALRNHPVINASIDAENEQIIYKEYVNVGVAVDTDRGLVVPNLRGADELSISEIARGLADMAENVRTGNFTVEDLRGSTFTISNLGAIGGTYSTPIVNVPEVAILLVGRSRKLPVVVGDEIKPRLMMPLSISYDHRLVDGAAAARFLNEVIGYLQAPGRLLLAP